MMVMFSHSGSQVYGAWRWQQAIDAGAGLQQVVKNLQRIRRRATRCVTLSSYTVAAIVAPEAKSAVYDWLVFELEHFTCGLMV